MGNNVKGIFIFLIFVSLNLGAKAITTFNTINNLTKFLSDSVKTDIDPDSIEIYGTLNYICPGDAWEIADCQIIFKGTTAEIYVQSFGGQTSKNEYILITLNKPVTDCLKSLLYAIYSDSNTALKDGIPNERSVIGSAKNDLSIKIIFNGKIVNEFFHVFDIQFSYSGFDPFKPSFYKMLELIEGILCKVDYEIYHGRRGEMATDWVKEKFNYNYYETDYRIVSYEILVLKNVANAIRTIFRMVRRSILFKTDRF